MAFYSVEAVEDAVERSKGIILPFDFLTWTKLAVIVLFLGGAGFSTIFFNFPFSAFSSFEEAGYHSEGSTEFHSDFNMQMMNSGPELVMPALGISILILGMAVVGLVLAMYLNSLAEFVMFSSIDSKDVQIRENISKYCIDAGKYFLFRAVYGAAFIALIIGWFGSFAVQPVLGLLLSIPALLLMILLAVFGWIVHDFALLKIIKTDTGFIESVTQVTRTVLDEWRQLGAYLVLRIIVAWAVSLMSLAAVGIVSLIFLLVFGIIAAIFGLISPVLAAIPVAIGFVLWLITLLYLVVPFRTYMYSFFVEVYSRFFG